MRAILFIDMALDIHGEDNDHDKTQYDNTNDKVIVTYPLHDDFEQTSQSRLIGKDCIKCGRIKALETVKQGINTEKFIQEAHDVHRHVLLSLIAINSVVCTILIISFYGFEH